LIDMYCTLGTAQVAEQAVYRCLHFQHEIPITQLPS